MYLNGPQESDMMDALNELEAKENRTDKEEQQLEFLRQTLDGFKEEMEREMEEEGICPECYGNGVIMIMVEYPDGEGGSNWLEEPAPCKHCQ